jgi:hypothetical protein
MNSACPFKKASVSFFVLCLGLCLAAAAYGKGKSAVAPPLSLTISVNTQTVTEPLPIRVTLHLHNPSQQTLWLYRPVRDGAEAGNDLDHPRGGATLITRLAPLSLPAGAALNLGAIGKVMKPAGMPHPRLVELDPGGDFEETLAIRLLPAMLRGTNGSSINPFYWGAYRFSVIYGAGYPNGDELRRDVGVAPWEGAVPSNALVITLAPSPPSFIGKISGSVVNEQSGFVGGALVSLSADNGHLLNQMVTNNSGRFSFTSLPLGTYWVTVREVGSTQAVGMFEHATLTARKPEAVLKLLFAREEVSDAKNLMHKPVFFRVTDSADDPVEDAILDDTWSNGPVMEDLKGRTNSNGVVVMEVLPGGNYISIKKKGCQSQDQRADVSDDIGVDGFKFIFDCEHQ